eukprot:5445419-Prymnesium_polylepis.1
MQHGRDQSSDQKLTLWQRSVSSNTPGSLPALVLFESEAKADAFVSKITHVAGERQRPLGRLVGAARHPSLSCYSVDTRHEHAMNTQSIHNTKFVRFTPPSLTSSPQQMHEA